MNTAGKKINVNINGCQTNKSKVLTRDYRKSKMKEKSCQTKLN